MVLNINTVTDELEETATARTLVEICSNAV